MTNQPSDQRSIGPTHPGSIPEMASKDAWRFIFPPKTHGTGAMIATSYVNISYDSEVIRGFALAPAKRKMIANS